MHRLSGLLIILTLLGAWCAPRAAAAIVYLRGSDQPIAGVIQQQDETRIVIAEQLADGQVRTREILRSEIEDIITTVSTQRLESLTPEQPAAYRDYAEELAEKRKDPEAATTSLRLYLIAAYLDPERLGRSSLLGLLNLARTPAEERKFRAMAYLLDPQHDKRILREPGTVQQEAPEEDEEARTMLLTAVRAARSGDRRTLTNMLKRPSFREVLHRWQGGLTYDELMGMPEEPSDELLARLLQLELALSRSGDAKGAPKNTSWSRIVQRDGVAPVPSLTLATLTDYDPRKCLFRDGQWVAPEPGERR